MVKKKKVAIIIQARVGSSRLPGKILMDIEGMPMLWHITDRLRLSKTADAVIVATTVNKEDDAVEALCRKHKIDFYRGSEDDVLDRYYQAAMAYDAGVVARICGDCPLIDYEATDMVISAYIDARDRFDGASNAIKRTYPRGLDTEVVSMPALKKVWEMAQERYQREHVLCYIHERPDVFKIRSVENDKDLSGLRWTVDEASDLTLVREIYKRLYEGHKVFLMKDILKVLEREPHLVSINEEVAQKDHRL